uniref:Malonyl-CoA decarboxylase C-terminal domain-containing protein n=1 Tax=Strigamia maritima TaxID=126957 RepID=T1JCC3_STRMM
MPVSQAMLESLQQVLQDSKLRQLCSLYKELDTDECAAFLQLLAQEFNVDHENVERLAQSFVDNKNKGEIFVVTCEEKLRKALTPQYHWLFSQIGRLEGGVKFLVDMRSQILAEIETHDKEDTSIYYLRALNSALKELLALWFSVGFLNLERVTWQSSCDMLQKVSDYEAVHPMRNWTDLKRRVGQYRRCFVFTHSSMPREPIVVLHTALTNEISKSIQGIVVQRVHSDTDVSGSMSGYEEDPRKITTAIFYSITSTQKGLQGIELGNYLIKRVVRQLQVEFPQMTQFSSLSPIPGFSQWLLQKITAVEKTPDLGNDLLAATEIAEIEALLPVVPGVDGPLANQTQNIWQKLRKTISTNSWVVNEKLSQKLETPLMRLCARYLYSEKHRGFALDSVANFHSRNGAVMWRLNWKADLSPRGLTNSCGIMVNYRYYLEQTEDNSARYLDEKFIKASPQIVQLARQQTQSSLSVTSNDEANTTGNDSPQI